jgi:hypothetical protein
MRNHPLATMTAKSSLVLLIVAIGLLAGASANAADPVYKWKDANGQSHYSQTPPDGIKYETIAASGAPASALAASGHADSGAAAKTATAPAATGTPTQAQVKRQELCDNARKNVDVLTTRPMVQMDINNTGTPVALTPAQQSQQLELAKQQTASYCAK